MADAVSTVETGDIGRTHNELSQGQKSPVFHGESLAESGVNREISDSLSQRQALRVLQERGFLQVYKGDLLDGQKLEELDIVCDLDKFRKGPYDTHSLKKEIGFLAISKKFDQRDLPSVLQRVFQDLAVYDKTQYHQDPTKAEKLPFFYIPSDANRARSATYAKKVAKYHLGIWEIGSSRKLPDKYPVSQSLREGQGAPGYRETVVMQLIFNPKYGNGYRDESGKLMVRFKGEGKHRPINWDFFEKWGFSGYSRKDGFSFDRPIELLYKDCLGITHLKGGSMYPYKDFQIRGGSPTDARYNLPKDIWANGTTMMQGLNARYTVGREYGNGNFESIRLTDDLAGIIEYRIQGEKNEKVIIPALVCVFELKLDAGFSRDRGTFSDVLQRGIKMYKGHDAIAGFDNKLGSIADNFGEFLDFSLQCSVYGEFKLAKFTLSEQAEALDIYRQYKDDPNFWNFIRSYKADGLRSLIALKETIPQVFEINAQVNPIVMKNIIHEASLIAETVNKSARGITDGNNSAKSLLDEAVLDQMRRIILGGLPLARGEKLTYNFIDLAALLKSFRERVEWHYSHLSDGESRLYQEIVRSLSHPDQNVQDIVLHLFRRDVQTEIDLVKLKARELFDPPQLEISQREAYTDSDLRAWERRTADTYQSLRHILLRFKERKEPVRYILDIGTGEGRIAGMLARLGYKVIGLDISDEQLQRRKERIKQEGQGLRGEKEIPGLSYHDLLKLQEEGLLPRTPILDDEEVANNYIQVQGSFFNIADALNKAGINFKFDAAIVTWHTYDEFGPPKSQEAILEQIWSLLNAGGELIKEIPNRKIEPYASALQKYHIDNPTEPYGTIRDKKPVGTGGQEELYPPRYFPDINELILLLKSKGFDIDLQKDVQTYMVEDKETLESERGPAFEEYFIVATKPKS